VVKSLSEALSEKTIDDAKAAIPGGGGGAEGELERLTRAACVKVCEKHAEEHEGKGETEEGGFWREMATAAAGKSTKARSAGGNASIDSVGGGAGAKVGADAGNRIPVAGNPESRGGASGDPAKDNRLLEDRLQAELRAGPVVCLRQVLLRQCPERCGFNNLSIPNMAWFLVEEYEDGTESKKFLECYKPGAPTPPPPV
jgi:hypothetical protein